MKTTQSAITILVAINGLSFFPRTNAMVPNANEKSWTYDFKSFESHSSQTDLVDINFNVERISRGVFAMSGTFKVDFDITEGDDTELEATSYRSDNGVSDFKVLPFKMPRQHAYKALNGFYKDMIMDTLKDCSDLPTFEEKFEPPFERKTYTLDKCQFSEDGFPNHLQDGFYKIILSGYGVVEWSLTIIVQVEKKF